MSPRLAVAPGSSGQPRPYLHRCDGLVINFDNVTKVYPNQNRPALENVNIEVAKGEFVFLVGPSGSGKSTFLRLVLKEERPTDGRIHVAGRDLARLSNWKVPYLRRRIGCVFQGSTGSLFVDYGSHLLYVKGKPVTDFKSPEPSIPNSPGHLREFLEQGFQILFRTLLAMETNHIMEWFRSGGQMAGHSKVCLRLGDPLTSHGFHRGRSLWS